jgi:hypothetical protein
MRLNLTDIALNDFVYKQNPDYSYIFNTDGSLQGNDMNAIVDTILENLKKIYGNIVTQNKINPGKIICNDYLLVQALTRYSRDIFGELRLLSKIESLRKLGVLTETQKNQLAQFPDYGFKIDSRSPYIHRQLAVLLYWLSVLKPFAVYPDNGDIVKDLGVAFEFHNEYISYFLCLSFLKVFNCYLGIHKSRDIFYDFLYDLHFRNLSRSSLEFFLWDNIELIKTSSEAIEGCPEKP